MSKLNDLPLVYKSFAAEPYTPNIGATIHGLDLSKPLSDVAKTELQDALAQYEVLFSVTKTSRPHSRWNSPAPLAM